MCDFSGLEFTAGYSCSRVYEYIEPWNATGGTFTATLGTIDKQVVQSG